MLCSLCLSDDLALVACSGAHWVGAGRGKQPPLQEIPFQYHSETAISRLLPQSFHSYTVTLSYTSQDPSRGHTNTPPQLIFGSVSLCSGTNCTVTCWGDMNKSLSIPDRTPTTDQRKDPSQVYLGELVSSRNLLTGVWLKVAYRGVENSKAAASLELPAQLVDSSGG